MKNTLQQNQKAYRQLRAVCLLVVGFDAGAVVLAIVQPVPVLGMLAFMLTMFVLLPLILYSVVLRKRIKAQTQTEGT